MKDISSKEAILCCFFSEIIMYIEYKIGDIIQTKKNHPCGSNLWEILRVGADVKLKCTTCGRIVMLTREETEKRTKKVISRAENCEERDI